MSWTFFIKNLNDTRVFEIFTFGKHTHILNWYSFLVEKFNIFIVTTLHLASFRNTVIAFNSFQTEQEIFRRDVCYQSFYNNGILLSEILYSVKRNVTTIQEYVYVVSWFYAAKSVGNSKCPDLEAKLSYKSPCLND